MPINSTIFNGTIYKIRNKLDNKVYIGQTTRNIKLRFNDHKKPVTRKKAIFSHLYNSISKYGLENFEFSIIIANITNINLLNDLEIHYIRLYNSQNPEKGYNYYSGGNNQISNIQLYSTCTDIVKYKTRQEKVNEAVKIKRMWGLLPQLTGAKLYVKKGRSHVKNRNRSIICNETNQIFVSITQASLSLQIGRKAISEVLNGRNLTTGKLQGKVLTFKYLENDKF